MKTILIPNDLSPEAENAFRYAVDFALTLPERINLIVVHVFAPHKVDPRLNVELVTTESLQYEHETIAALNKMADKFKDSFGFESQLYCTRGSVDEQIARFAASHHADYIFMGTKGAHGIKAVLQGSNTSSVVEMAPCPVLAIPDKTVFSPLHRIVFASDFSDHDLVYMHKTIDLAKHYNARVVLLHLSDKARVGEDLQVLEWMRELVLKETSYSHIEVEALPADNFNTALEAELTRLQAGMLVMVPRRHNFFQNLLGRSHTRSMLHQATFPVLAMPAGTLAEAPVANAEGIIEEVDLA